MFNRGATYPDSLSVNDMRLYRFLSINMFSSYCVADVYDAKYCDGTLISASLVLHRHSFYVHICNIIICYRTLLSPRVSYSISKFHHEFMRC